MRPRIFGTSAGLYAVGFLAPLLVREPGPSPFDVGLPVAIPNLIAVIGMGARIAQFRQYRRTLRPRCRSCILGAVGMANHRAAGRRSHLPAPAMRKYQNFSNPLELKLQQGHLVLALCCLGNKALPPCRGNGKSNFIREPATLPLG